LIEPATTSISNFDFSLGEGVTRLGILQNICEIEK